MVSWAVWGESMWGFADERGRRDIQWAGLGCCVHEEAVAGDVERYSPGDGGN